MSEEGTQPNGLPVHCTFDTVGTHDFCDVDQWVASNNSKWTLVPPANKAYNITGVQMVFSSDMYMPKSRAGLDGDYEFLVQLYITDRTGEYDVLAAEYPYYDMRDWFRRALKKTKYDWEGSTGSAVTGPVWQFDMDLSQQIVLWSTSDFNGGSPAVDDEGNVKLSKMVLKIRGDVPYLKVQGGDPAEIASGKYFIEVYSDPVT